MIGEAEGRAGTAPEVGSSVAETVKLRMMGSEAPFNTSAS